MTYKETPQQGEEDFSISLKQGRPIHEKCQARIAELEGENERLTARALKAEETDAISFKHANAAILRASELEAELSQLREERDKLVIENGALVAAIKTAVGKFHWYRHNWSPLLVDEYMEIIDPLEATAQNLSQAATQHEEEIKAQGAREERDWILKAFKDLMPPYFDIDPRYTGWKKGISQCKRVIEALAPGGTRPLESLTPEPVHAYDCGITINARHNCTCGAENV